MFGKPIDLFKLHGFQVRLDLSWIVIAVLVVWSLAVGFFPGQYPDLAPRAYWFMGVVAALGLFASIVAHELTHSVVARRFGIPMKGITLFIFGGVAEMGDEPPNARAEFSMAVVGPLSSGAIALVFYGIHAVGVRVGLPIWINGIMGYLGWINGLLAAFNLIPAFPLDGGRILRSVLWGVKKNLRWATMVSSRIGSGFGVFLIVIGAFSVIRGNFITGMWWFLIGLFLRGAANGSYQQLLTRRALEGEAVKRFMRTDPVSVPPALSIERLVEDHIYKLHYKMYPVVDDSGTVIGCITTKQVKETPREEWGQRTVGELAEKCSPDNTIGPETDAVHALAAMSRLGTSRLMVVEEGRLMGIIALKDMLKFLALKVELEA